MVNSTNPGFSYRPPNSGWDKPLNLSAKLERPAGVTAIAVLSFIASGLLVLMLLVDILAPRVVTRRPIASDQDESSVSFMQLFQEEQASAQTTKLLCTSLAAVPFGLAVGIGLWRLCSWARTLTLFSHGAGTILLLLLNFSTPLTGASLVAIMASATIFVYLLRPEVGAAFGEEI